MSRTRALAHRATSLALSGLSFVAPRAAGRIATYLWFTPFPFAWSRVKPLPPGARPIAFGAPHSPVTGYEMGAGPRQALLIHGWAGSSRQYGRLATRLAGDGYRVAVIDLPAHGRDAGRSTDLFEIADAIEVTGRELGRIDIVVAHSLGAMATAVAMQRSLRADRLVFVAPGVSPRHALDTFAAALRLRPRVTRSVEAEMESRFGGGVWDDIPGAVFDMTVPGHTLVVYDRDDDMISVASAETLAERWGAGVLATTGHGHNGVLRAAEVIDRIAALAAAGPAPATA